jgi:methyltransferase family protein
MAYEELKQRQSVMWGSGPYQRVTETIADIHEMIIGRLKPRAGERWLDLACGTGAVAERAARLVAKVTGLDLAPELLEQAKASARRRKVSTKAAMGSRTTASGFGFSGRRSRTGCGMRAETKRGWRIEDGGWRGLRNAMRDARHGGFVRWRTGCEMREEGREWKIEDGGWSQKATESGAGTAKQSFEDKGVPK